MIKQITNYIFQSRLQTFIFPLLLKKLKGIIINSGTSDVNMDTFDSVCSQIDFGAI